MRIFAVVAISIGAIALAACGDSTTGDGAPPIDPADANATQSDGGAAGDGALLGDGGSSNDATSSSDAARDGASSDSSPPPSPICAGNGAGLYCGNDGVTNGDPSTLYQCPGANQPPTSSQHCADGCQSQPPGVPDNCKVAVSPNGYKLPWPAGTTMQLTQDCNDSCCNDHVGNDEYAWDFANGGGFPIHASRGGTVTHLKINSTTGCGTSSCVNDANYIVIDHGDGSETVYLHLQGGTLAAGVTCGGAVTQGQHLATSGTTGWSTGIHLHFQANPVHSGAPTCECGAAGTGCATNTVPWADFWPNATYPTTAIAFVEWPSASQCANRRITLPASQN